MLVQVLILNAAGDAGMNILICTPGRLLHHMEQTPGFNADGLQLLVLDEADRILDMVCPYACRATISKLLEANAESCTLPRQLHCRSRAHFMLWTKMQAGSYLTIACWCLPFTEHNHVSWPLLLG